jgi:hypothetical protein
MDEDRAARHILVVYGLVWFAGLTIGLLGHWLLALAVSAAYVGMHVYESKYRHHCLLSVGRWNRPVSLVLLYASVLGLRAAGWPLLPGAPLWVEMLLVYAVYSVVLVAGHTAAFAYLGIAWLWLMCWRAWRRR